MRIQPRQQLLELWRSAVKASYQDGEWSWGGRYEPNSISDAEQLLCLLYPATQVPSFRLDRPDQTLDDVLAPLQPMGDAITVPLRMIRLLNDYMDTYTTVDGAPVFSGGARFVPADDADEPTKEQRAIDIVDSYSMSVTLTLSTLGFLKVFRTAVSRPQLLEEIDRLEESASRRLTAAMIGLLRSFTVNAFTPDSEHGRVLLRTVNQSGLPDRRIVEDLRQALVDIRASLQDVRLGFSETEALDNPGLLFECGWAWGVVEGSPPVVDIAVDYGPQADGLAGTRPYLYFTVVALDGIADLFTERTRVLGLLNPEQQRLSQALQIRWDLTQRYWSTIASLGSGRWPLEDLPWRTTDGEESDYYSLSVTSVTVQNLVERRAGDADLSRVADVLTELANRARLTRRPLLDDRAMELHAPGIRLKLFGAENLGPRIDWIVSDFSAMLLKRTIALAALARGTELRERLLRLVDDIWDHLLKRRLSGGPATGLWDVAAGAFPGLPVAGDAASWSFSERVVESLVLAANVAGEDPLRSGRLYDFARDLISEADHLLSQALMGPASLPLRDDLRRSEASLQRARELVADRPGSSVALSLQVLRRLDELAAARQDVARSS